MYNYVDILMFNVTGFKFSQTSEPARVSKTTIYDAENGDVFISCPLFKDGTFFTFLILINNPLLPIDLFFSIGRKAALGEDRHPTAQAS